MLYYSQKLLRYCKEEDDDWFPGLVCLWILVCFAVIASLVFLYNGASDLLNPGYAAFQNIVEQLKGQ